MVSDDKGGTATKTETITVYPAIVTKDMPVVQSEGGYLEQGGITNHIVLYAGDSGSNKKCRGFISFDITGLAGATVNDATLKFNLKKKWGDPSFFGNLRIYALDWGENPIDQSIFWLGIFNVNVANFSSSGSGNLTCSNTNLIDELQKAINDGKSRFQIRIHFSGFPDLDNAWDGWEYNQSGVNLNVVFWGI